MNRIKIAKEIIKVAKMLMADDESAYIVFTDDGAVEDISSSLFNSIFKTASVRHCRSRRASDDGYHKAVIYVSPEVNSTGEENGRFFHDIYVGIKNYLSTMKNSFSHLKQIQQSIRENEDSDRIERKDPLGFSIIKQKGLYSYVDDNGQLHDCTENSYAITIFGSTREEANRIAMDLKRRFSQKGVIVEFTKNVDSTYLE